MATKKARGLGRGLDALFEDQAVIDAVSERRISNTRKTLNQQDESSGVIEINISDIKPNANQPRKVFDEEKITELSNSIRTHGVIQPIVVRRARVGYEIVAGERRWRAARKAALKSVPCLIREFTDEQNMLVAIIENMQREDLNPIEEAEGLEKMMTMYKMTQEEISKNVSKSRPYIANALRLLNLNEEVRDMVSSGKLSAGHGRAILAVGKPQEQKTLAEKVLKEGLSVRETERLASSGTSKKRKAKPLKKVKSKDVMSVEQELRDILGTKVNINMNGGKGSIELEYYSRDELDRLIDRLRDLK